AHRLRDGGPRRLLVEVHADEPVAVEIDVVFLLGAPLAVVEDDGSDGNALAHAGLQLTEAHAPRAVADIRDGRPIRRRHLRADNGRKCVAAIAEAHRREHRARTIETQVAVRYRADVADVRRHHRAVGHRALQLAQHLTRMHVRRLRADFHRPAVLFVRPAVELALPRTLLVAQRREPRIAIRDAGELLAR